jgi:hypothetical protein
MPDDQSNAPRLREDARWPFVFLYLCVLGGIFGTANNTDPIEFNYSVSVVVGLIAVAGDVAYFAIGRLKGHALFGFGDRTIPQNIAWHVFILTGIVFLSFLFFGCLIQIMVISFHAPIFDASDFSGR